jgi:hypothetical protein
MQYIYTVINNLETADMEVNSKVLRAVSQGKQMKVTFTKKLKHTLSGKFLLIFGSGFLAFLSYNRNPNHYTKLLLHVSFYMDKKLRAQTQWENI